jgi:hypothetical protein
MTKGRGGRKVMAEGRDEGKKAMADGRKKGML